MRPKRKKEKVKWERVQVLHYQLKYLLFQQNFTNKTYFESLKKKTYFS